MSTTYEPTVIHHGLVESDEGPETGHRYRFAITSCSAVRDAQHPERLTDSEWWGQLRTVEVRAHSLKDALLKAAELPNQIWFEADGQAPVMPADQLR